MVATTRLLLAAIRTIAQCALYTWLDWRMTAYDKRKQANTAQAKRPWHGWYKTKRWLQRREAQLSAEPLCVMCLQSEIVTAASVADHVTPHRGDADLFWYGDLQSLCSTHHSRDKQIEEHGKTVVRYGVDGWPV